MQACVPKNGISREPRLVSFIFFLPLRPASSSNTLTSTFSWILLPPMSSIPLFINPSTLRSRCPPRFQYQRDPVKFNAKKQILQTFVNFFSDSPNEGTLGWVEVSDPSYSWPASERAAASELLLQSNGTWRKLGSLGKVAARSEPRREPHKARASTSEKHSKAARS